MDLYLSCLRCGHKWVRRNPDKLPDTCPKCKSPYWNKERKKHLYLQEWNTQEEDEAWKDL